MPMPNRWTVVTQKVKRKPTGLDGWVTGCFPYDVVQNAALSLLAGFQEREMKSFEIISALSYTGLRRQPYGL